MAIEFHVVQDWKENPRKCSVEPLRGTPHLRLFRLGAFRAGDARHSVGPGLLLAVNAPVLSRVDRGFLANGGEVIALDSTWARVETLRRRLDLPRPDEVVERSLPPEIVTAYPRRSKVFADPKGGLATVEAIYVASLILGDPRPDFIARYHWRDSFLALNREALEPLWPEES